MCVDIWGFGGCVDVMCVDIWGFGGCVDVMCVDMWGYGGCIDLTVGQHYLISLVSTKLFTLYKCYHIKNSLGNHRYKIIGNHNNFQYI